MLCWLRWEHRLCSCYGLFVASQDLTANVRDTKRTIRGESFRLQWFLEDERSYRWILRDGRSRLMPWNESKRTPLRNLNRKAIVELLAYERTLNYSQLCIMCFYTMNSRLLVQLTHMIVSNRVQSRGWNQMIINLT